MDAFQAIVLGIVQGLTEFLPVSSTGHLRIVPAFLGWEDPGAAFTAVTQLGTMAAVLIFFRADLLRIARTWFASLRRPELRGEADARMGWYIGLGTIPIAIFGFIFKDQIESGARDLYLIGAALIVLGLVLYAADRTQPQAREFETIGRRDAIVIGFAQALALVPAVVLSGLFELRKIGEGGGAAAVPTAIAALLAFVVGYASIAFLLRWLASHSVGVFVVYRAGIGALVLALTAAGAIS